jgi:1,4-alpha-glucan branching enzyme
LFHEGRLKEVWRHFGAHLVKDANGQSLGVWFTVYAPHARIVSVVGDFNGWDSRTHVMEKVDPSGIYSLYVHGISEWARYKYCLVTGYGQTIFKADPVAFFSDLRPETSSKVYDLEGYAWHDDTYLRRRKEQHGANRPMAIYEVHLGTWMRKPDGSVHAYNEIADRLIAHVKAHGFTHIELMPVIEHPLDESWGYQGTGYYSATSRYGVPKDLMYFVDRCHAESIGVLFDWVPGHICKDAHGLYLFDGEPLYEYQEYRIRENEVWGTVNLDLGKGITRSFLISNALFWIRYFHADGFRIDAVSNILYYLGDSRMGENPGAIGFLRELNQAVKAQDPSVWMIAEDSTTYPYLTKPVFEGGIGFDYKWNMGWMNDTLTYFSKDPIYRKFHHDKMTFGMVYAYSERFILPFSHDEVVHGKKSLLSKMPGDYWQQFASYRALIGFQYTYPGKKLLFMGDEFAQVIEWNDQIELDWLLFQYPMHEAANRFVKDLGQVYLHHRALYELDHDPAGFHWIDADNHDQSVFIYARFGYQKDDCLVVVLNMTPNTYPQYHLGVPLAGTYQEILNSDKAIYGGSGLHNGETLESFPESMHHEPHQIICQVAPLAILIFKYSGKGQST